MDGHTNAGLKYIDKHLNIGQNSRAGDTKFGIKRIDENSNIELKHMGEQGEVKTETCGRTRNGSN